MSEIESACPRCYKSIEDHAEATVDGEEMIICPTTDGTETGVPP